MGRGSAPPPEGCFPVMHEGLCSYIMRTNSNFALCPEHGDPRPCHHRFMTFINPIFLAYVLAISIDVTKIAHKDDTLDSFYTTVFAALVLTAFNFLMKSYQYCMHGSCGRGTDEDKGEQGMFMCLLTNLDAVICGGLLISDIIATVVVHNQTVTLDGTEMLTGKLLEWRLVHQFIPVILTYLIFLDAAISCVLYFVWYWGTCACCVADSTPKPMEKKPLKAEDNA